jgi:hypothetical protein
MRSFGVCAILLALAAVAPPPSLRTEYEPLWAFGALLLLAVTAQNALARIRLPPLTGWILAALFLGPTLLAAVDASRVALLDFVGMLAGLWTGLLVGLGAQWPAVRRTWRVPAVVAASTLVTFGGLATAIGLVSGLPWRVVLVFAAVGSLWGPVVSDFWRSRETLVVGLVGAGGALVLLGGAILASAGSSGVAATGTDWVLRLFSSMLVAAIVAEGLWRLRLLERRDSALLALGAATLVGALAALEGSLPTLPMGLVAGVVLAVREGSGRQLGHLLAPARSLSILVFAAVLVARADFAPLLAPAGPWLVEIVLAQLVILVLTRGIGPALWYPMPSSGDFSRRSGGLLLPKGLIAAELVLSGGLGSALTPSHADLLRGVVLADLLVYGILLAALAALVPPRSGAEPSMARVETA